CATHIHPPHPIRGYSTNRSLRLDCIGWSVPNLRPDSPSAPVHLPFDTQTVHNHYQLNPQMGKTTIRYRLWSDKDLSPSSPSFPHQIVLSSGLPMRFLLRNLLAPCAKLLPPKGKMPIYVLPLIARLHPTAPIG